MASAASPASAESDPPRWNYDVFLSFRGEDTRRAFVSHLDRALAYWQAMKTFKDDRDLEVGATIRPELLTAIEESYLAIIVLSPNYASSTWCLDELSKIVECMEDTKRILPIFYHVDPSDVRNQRGSFAEAFTKHEERFSGDTEKLNRWRAALRKVADLSGLHSTTYKSEAELIEDIVKRVWKKVNPTFTLLDSEEKLVGFDFALDQLRLHLAPEENDVHFMGIWGMGGVGITTLANLVYQKISHHFEHRCFLPNVRKGEVSGLGRQLLSSILKENYIPGWDEGEVTLFIKNRLWNKKVLLVLDDVDHQNQLEKLVGNKNCFCEGSRIIITTRNERVLVESDVAIRYKFEVLKNDEALELFSRHAFKKSRPEEDFLQLSKCFVHYAKGLPLALKTLGCSLYERGQDTWNSALDNLKKIPNPTIFDSLKISYDGLEHVDQEIFLDVACFYKGKDKEQVIETLDSIYDISSRHRIDILVEKSLFTFEKYNVVEMHDLIQEMAWRIIRLESSREPGQRSRLWLHDDISGVFMNNMGTRKIVAMVLHLFKLEVVHCKCDKVFSEMSGLKLLDFDNVIISEDPKDLPNSLRLLRWSWYPSKSLPSSFHPRFLVKLEMRHSKLFWLWDGAKDLPNLKCIDLSYSDKLTNTPDFTGIPNLEKLNLKNCTNLVEVHTSIAILKKLKHLDLSECKSIKSLPSKMEMDSLENFSLCGCSKLKKLPEFEGHMKNSFKLILKGTAVEKIPSSIEGVVGLAVLGMNYPTSLSGQIVYMQRSLKLVKLPGEMECLEELELSESPIRELLLFMKNHKYLSFHRSSTSRDGRAWFRLRKSHPDPKPDPWGLVLSTLNHLCSLTSLYLSDCNIGEGVIPDNIGYLPSLESLYLSGNNFISLPASVRFLSNLWHLDLRRCERLEQLPDLPPKRSSLLEVFVDDCIVLKKLSDPSKLSAGANVYDFDFGCLNCFRLVEEEDWINRIFAMIMRLAPRIGNSIIGTDIVWPGSEIPDWFDNRSAGDSITVEQPVPPQPSSHWIGIALCVVFEDSEYFENPDALVGYGFFEIKNRGGAGHTFGIGHLKSQHLWAFYLPRDSYTTFGYDDIQPKRKRDGSCSHRFSFEAFYGSFGGPSSKQLKTNSSIKKCGARLVYEKDLEEFTRILKIPNPALQQPLAEL